MTDLPTLTDEQIDAAWEAMTAPIATGVHGECNRSSNRWTALRAAFPAPKPPLPEWKDDEIAVTVATATEHSLPRDVVGVWLARGATYALLSARVAREMADALHRASDYVEEQA